jgi:hypothetical protein
MSNKIPYNKLTEQLVNSGKFRPNNDAKLRVERAKKQAEMFQQKREQAKSIRGFALIAELPKPKTRIIQKLTQLIKNGKSNNSINNND